MPRTDRPHADCPLCGRTVNTRRNGTFINHADSVLPTYCWASGHTSAQAQAYRRAGRRKEEPAPRPEPFGCSDGGCVWLPHNSGGMHTNGGCHCLTLGMTRQEMRQTREGIRWLVEERERLLRLVAVLGGARC